MTATIREIYPPKWGNGHFYQRVVFEPWSQVYLCADMANFARWRPLLKVGNVLTNLKLKKKGLVSADSYPRSQ